MNHPIFGNRKHICIYFAVWIAIAAIHILLLRTVYSIKTSVAISDGVVFNMLFSLLGIPLWYIVAYAKRGRYSGLNQLINHITSITIIVIIWISAGGMLVKMVVKDNSYLTFYDNSLTWRIISGIFFYSLLTLFYYVVMYYNETQEQALRESNLQTIVKQAALDNLRAQINPHFLFNSLNSISSLTITSPEKAQEMIIKLSDFLRYSISQTDERFSKLQQELDNIKLYLDIETVRFGAKLINQFTIADACQHCEVPTMILQPLYENAVKHGVYESTEPITITTTCSINGNLLQVTISNNFDHEAHSKKGAGIGLKNIKERLRLIYGSGDLLRTKSVDHVFTATVIIPQKEML